MEITFTNPIYLWGFLAVPVLIVLYFFSLKYSKSVSLKFANFIALSRVAGTIGESSNISVLLIRIFVLICIILSISGMTIWYLGPSASKDYVLAIDSSASMAGVDDLKPNRLEAVKSAAENFISDMPFNSYVGVVSFSGTSFVEQTLTQEKSLAREAVKGIKLNIIGGTDLGNAIITSTNLLMNGKKARAIVLLTDGRSNIGISDETAILYANNNHVVVNTIGIGAKETIGNDSLYLGVEEEELKKIANMTSGNYYYVKDSEDLKNVYSEIVKNPTIGKNPIELAFPLLLIALVFLLIDWVLGNTIYKRLP